MVVEANDDILQRKVNLSKPFDESNNNVVEETTGDTLHRKEKSLKNLDDNAKELSEPKRVREMEEVNGKCEDLASSVEVRVDSGLVKKIP